MGKPNIVQKLKRGAIAVRDFEAADFQWLTTYYWQEIYPEVEQKKRDAKKKKANNKAD